MLEMIRRMHYLTVFSLALVLGCSTERHPSSEPSPIVAPEVKSVPAALNGFAECHANVCSFHFAREATGNAVGISSEHCMGLVPDCRPSKGKLTATARAKVQAFSAAAEAEPLLDAYGCPGCADGPVYKLVLHHADGRVSRHAFDPMYPSELPRRLAEAAALLQPIIAALDRCETTDLFVADADCRKTIEEFGNLPVGTP